MKNLDCNQIKIFIILEIIGEEYKKKNYIFFFLNLKKIAIFTCSNIIYLIYIYIYIYIYLLDEHILRRIR